MNTSHYRNDEDMGLDWKLPSTLYFGSLPLGAAKELV